MSYAKGLKCRECGHEYELKATHVCEMCFGPLEVDYDYDAIKKVTSREKILAGPRSIWRYADFLPADASTAISLGEGYTPLIKAERLGKELGLKNLYIKNDCGNPTNSFKDRVVSVAVSWATSRGFETLSCASTGNLANSVAAYGKRAGMNTYVFVPANLEAAKIAITSVFSPNIVAVQGNYDEVNRLCSELADRYKWAFTNINIRPYYAEGSKTTTFEVIEQLGWQVPDEIVVPIASGCQFVKHYKAFSEFAKMGLIEDKKPRMTGAQATGCSPVSKAFKEGHNIITPVKPNTIAKSIAIGNPSDGSYVIDYANETGGAVDDVSEEQIVEGIKMLARTEGIFAETAGGVTIATLAKLVAAGRYKGRENDTIVAYITGHGFKTIEVLGDTVTGLRKEINANIASFEESYPEIAAKYSKK